MLPQFLGDLRQIRTDFDSTIGEPKPLVVGRESSSIASSRLACDHVLTDLGISKESIDGYVDIWGFDASTDYDRFAYWLLKNNLPIGKKLDLLYYRGEEYHRLGKDFELYEDTKPGLKRSLMYGVGKVVGVTGNCRTVANEKAEELVNETFVDQFGVQRRLMEEDIVSGDTTSKASMISSREPGRKLFIGDNLVDLSAYSQKIGHESDNLSLGLRVKIGQAPIQQKVGNFVSVVDYFHAIGDPLFNMIALGQGGLSKLFIDMGIGGNDAEQMIDILNKLDFSKPELCRELCIQNGVRTELVEFWTFLFGGVYAKLDSKESKRDRDFYMYGIFSQLNKCLYSNRIDKRARDRIDLEDYRYRMALKSELLQHTMSAITRERD